MLFDGTIGLFQTLKEIGLTAKEANLYLAMHDIGANPASVIAKKCGLNRSGCYNLLNTLSVKGFAQKSYKNNILYFRATDPKVILRQLKIKQGRLGDTIRNIGGLITQFDTMQKDCAIKPSVVFFEGPAAIKNIMEDTLEAGSAVRVYAGSGDMFPPQSNNWEDYEERCMRREIRLKIIYPRPGQTPAENGLKKNSIHRLSETRFIRPEFNFHLNIIIYGNKVALVSLRENFGLTVESEEISRAYKKIFDLVWEGSLTEK